MTKPPIAVTSLLYQLTEGLILIFDCQNDLKPGSLFSGRESILFFSHTNPRATNRVHAHEVGVACRPVPAARTLYKRGKRI
jgi:hypothetical protein